MYACMTPVGFDTSTSLRTTVLRVSNNIIKIMKSSSLVNTHLAKAQKQI